MKVFKNFLLVAGFIFMATQALSSGLISNETIQIQKKLTKKLQLTNGIPVIIRNSESSDIVQIDFNFRYGFRDHKQADKVFSELMFSTMSRSAKDWPKDLVFQTLERYSAHIGCNIGIEISSCKMSVIEDFWLEILPLFAAIIQKPSFAPDDLELVRHNQQSRLKSRWERPDFVANEITNRIFYGKEHPYFLALDEQIRYLEKIDRERIVSLHKQLISSHIDSIVVVASLAEKEILEQLEKVFGNLRHGDYNTAAVPLPGQKAGKDFIFEDRKIPTAYIRLKMPMPGVTDSDFEAGNLMIKVLDEELGLEIRTRRSLSYAVFGYVINYSRGIGMIGVSTSRPKETLEAISQVLKRMKSYDFKDNELQQYKTVYTTSYFLNMEEHTSLASSLSRFWFYYRNTDPMYEAPKRLAMLKAKDVKAAARKYLVNFKMGVVFDRSQFQDAWAENFLKDHRS